MKIIKNKKQLKESINGLTSLSFVPTMGGLHKGHISIIKKALRKSKNVIVSIFVNHKQFNSKRDYLNYPRNIKKDIQKLKKLKIKFLFVPVTRDIYNFKPQFPIYLDKFEKKLCGKYRPGHFKGVVNVVNRLIEIIKPKYIFLGDKDFQQYILIKKHIIKNKIQTVALNCKTIRDSYGLAFSTRNFNLNNKQLMQARKCISFLKKNKANLKRNNFNKKYFIFLKKRLVSLGAKKINYLEVLNKKTLKKPKNNQKNFNIFIAFYVGKIRLIDNF